MAKQQIDEQLPNDEFTKIFDAYRVKIDEITQRTQRNLHNNNEEPDNDSEITVEHVSRVPAEPENQPKINNGPIKIELSAIKESEEIINEAKRKAQQMIAEAESDIRKEARKKTQLQVEKILDNARQEAEDIIAQAKDEAQENRDEAVLTVKQEAAQLIREITEKCRQDTQEQSSQIIAEAEEKAAKMMADVVKSGQEISRLVEEILSKSRKTINEFETKLQLDTGELAKVISETQMRLQQITVVAEEDEEEPEPEPQEKNKETYKNPTLAVHLLGNKSNGKHNTSGLFSGQLEMKSLSASFDYQYLKALKRYLIHIPNIKYLQESASERETTVSFDIKEPLPLMDILNKVPLVDKIVAENEDDICIIFKNPR
jgi:vacuolar-type H+-ATPase subunit H